MTTTPHFTPDPRGDTFGQPDPHPELDPHPEPDPQPDPHPEPTAAPECGPASDPPLHTATWHGSIPSVDVDWYDDDPASEVATGSGTLYASGPGLPARGILLSTSAAAAGCAALNFALTGSMGFFFDLCFVVICLVAAMAASPRALFTVGVMPPLVLGALIAAVSLVAPASITTGSFSKVFLTGLAAHAVPLVVGYAVALAVASCRGIAHRSPRSRA